MAVKINASLLGWGTLWYSRLVPEILEELLHEDKEMLITHDVMTQKTIV